MADNIDLTAVSPGDAGTIFPIDLIVDDSASTGDAETQCSYTYTVRHRITGKLLGNAVDPTAAPHMWIRPSVGHMLAANFGYAHYEEPIDEGVDGDYVIGWINEVLETEACNTEESPGGG